MKQRAPQTTADRDIIDTMAKAGPQTTGPQGRGKPKSICLFGLFGMDNYGNDGSLEAMLAFLRSTWPDANYTCICLDPAKVREVHGIQTMPISWPGFKNRVLRVCDKATGTALRKLVNWGMAVNRIRKFDVLIVPGTSTLCDYRASPFGAPYALFRWAAAARWCGTRLCFVSTGAGPIIRPLSRAMLVFAAKSAFYRSFRDTVSRDYMTGVGVDTRKDVVYPDLAFKLPVPPANGRPGKRGVTIGLGVMDYNGWHGHAMPDAAIYTTYLMKLVALATALLDQGYTIRLLVGESADTRAVADLVTLLQGRGSVGDGPEVNQRIITEPVASLHDLMRQMAETDVVVASRYHNVICALRLAKPVLSLGYEAKHDAVMADFGLGEFCHHIERFEVPPLLQQVDLLLRNSDEYRALIGRRLVTIEQRLQDQEQRLVEVL
ncbi:MAG TPA: polysaccharide pyruvyl transferase family protein [Acetobacteraceae bacterium]|jgi:polysaccharide pyruvyl transferase WcaK-like protein|nr:polysaccharide pyruvyl transferase family protein [Acetobacteraceae bacterium]